MTGLSPVRIVPCPAHSKAAGKIPAAIWHRIQLRILSFALYCFSAHLRQLLLDPAELLGNRVLRHALHLRNPLLLPS